MPGAGDGAAYCTIALPPSSARTLPDRLWHAFAKDQFPVKLYPTVHVYLNRPRLLLFARDHEALKLEDRLEL